MSKVGKVNTLLIGMDVIGFSIMLTGAALIRFSKDEVLAIIGGFVLSGGIAVLSLTRYLSGK